MQISENIKIRDGGPLLEQQSKMAPSLKIMKLFKR